MKFFGTEKTTDAAAFVVVATLTIGLILSAVAWNISRTVQGIATDPTFRYQIQPGELLLILLISGALVLKIRQRSGSDIFPKALAWAALLISGVALLEQLSGGSLGLLSNLFHGSCAPDTLFGIFILALLIGTSFRISGSAYFAGSVSLVGIIGLAGYAVDFEPAQLSGTYDRIAPQTAAVFVVLGALTIYANKIEELTEDQSRQFRIWLSVLLGGLCMSLSLWTGAVSVEHERISQLIRTNSQMASRLIEERISHSLDGLAPLMDRFNWAAPAEQPNDEQVRTDALLAKNSPISRLDWVTISPSLALETLQTIRTSAESTTDFRALNNLEQPLRIAFETGAVRATGPHGSVKGGGRNILLVVPLYSGAADGAGAEGAAHSTALLATLPTHRLFAASPRHSASLQFTTQVTDITDSAKPAAVFIDPTAQDLGVRSEKRWRGYREQVTVAVAGRVWKIEYTPTADYLGRLRSQLPSVILGCGLLVTGLFAWAICFLVRQTSQAQQLVRERTEEVSKLNEGLEESEIFRALSMQAPVGIFQADAVGNVVFVNPALEQITGRLAADLYEQRWMKHLHPDDCDHLAAEWQQAIRNHSGGAAEVRFVRPDGEIRWVARRWSPVSGGSDELVGFVGIDVDITDRQRVDEALTIAAAAKTQFLANMSHEIRTPLTTILGFSEALQREELQGQERHQALDTILRNGEHLLSLINDILDFSKIEAGRLPVELERTCYIEILENVVRSLIAKASAKNITLASDYSYPLPAFLTTDSLRLQQILFNLVGNAVKFTEKGGVKVSVSYSAAVQRMEFAIVDTGIGITPEQMPRLFEVFEQGDYSRTKKFGGTGLGLAISQRLVERLGGAIRVESKPRCGSTFLITFPVSPADAKELIREHVSPQHSAEAVVTPKFCGKVLVVEDGADNQLLMRFLLHRAGIDADFASNGQEGVERTRGAQYDLILMDMQMPVMDGFTATELLRKQGTQVPIVAVTAEATPEGKSSCMKSGCSEILSKPFSQDDFYKTLGRYLGSESNPSPSAGAPDQFAEICLSFWSRFTDRIDEITALIRSEDFTGIQRVAHKLKGARMFGSDEVGVAAGALEHAAKLGDLEIVKHEFDRLKAAEPEVYPDKPIF